MASTAAIAEGAPPYAAVAAISAAALALEVLLLRLFSLLHWHHSAYMAISLALLGFGLSGTLLTLLQATIRKRQARVFQACTVLFSLAVPGSFLLAQAIPFNALTMLWDGGQWLNLGGIYLALMVPFLFAGTCIGLSFRMCPQHIPRLYAADLLGAGSGCVLALVALSVVSPARLLLCCAALGLLAAALVPTVGSGRGPIARKILLLCMAAFVALAPNTWLPLQESQHKTLSRTLLIPGTDVIARVSSALAEISVVRSTGAPFRSAPGLSLAARSGVPEQLGLFFDRDRMETVDRFTGNIDSVAYVDDLVSAAPYQLSRWQQAPPRVFLAGLSSADLLQAHRHEAAVVDIAEPDAQLARLFTETLADFSGWEHLGDRARVHVTDARSFLLSEEQASDLIVFPLTGSGTGTLSGATAGGEVFLLTRDAVRQAWQRLSERGVLVATVRLQVPPRASLRLLATFAEVARGAGIAEPGRHIAVLRSWQTVTLLLSRRALDGADLRDLSAFARERMFDLAWLPGLQPAETNRFNRLEFPWLYDGARRILEGDAERFYREYKFDIRPVTDDRPYFGQFLKARVLPELFQKRASGALALVDIAYPLLWATLAQALLLGGLLIVTPLFLLPRSTWRARSQPRAFAHVALYFTAIGLGFLFLEIAFLQRFTLYVGHPVLATALVLGVFLVSAGAGSGIAGRLLPTRRNLARVSIAILLMGIGWVSLAGPLHALIAGLDLWPRMILLAALCAPLAFLLGMPLALGMARVRKLNPDWIPWAWGINACASVVAAVAALLIAIHGGYTVLVSIALLLYLLLPVVRP